MDPITQQTVLAAAGAAGGDPVYVDDVFSTFLYDGTGSAQTNTNGIDLSGEGGLVWIKSRDYSQSNRIFDTERGVGETLRTNGTEGSIANASTITSFNNNGFTLGTDANGFGVNETNRDYVSWTFRKAPGFFDVVTYTGSGSGTKTISHNLGSVPGMIIVKGTNAGSDWSVYHRNLNGGSSPEDWYLSLNHPYTESNAVANWGGTAPTATEFTVGGNTNASINYVAYIFAHDEPVFGTDGDESIIKCGSFTNNGSQVTEENLGFEPQWVLIKNATATEDWHIFDVTRGMDITKVAKLWPNKDTYEDVSGYPIVYPTATGFTVTTASAGDWVNGTYIYMAIRRPHKPPTAATEVFNPILADTPRTAAQRPEKVDMYWFGKTGGWAENIQVSDRVRGFQNTNSGGDDSHTSPWMITNDVNQEATSGGAIAQENSSGGPFVIGVSAGSNFINYIFKRAPGFFDIVAYTGTGSNTTVNHNLEATPELMIIKRRNSGDHWAVYSSAIGTATHLELNNTGGQKSSSNLFNNTNPTASVFSLSTNSQVNGSTDTYITYLFATLPGISKVGSYTGNGGAQTIDCGFTNGARFVLIKQTDGVNNWRVFDTLRGIGAGNDPVLSLSNTAAQDTNKNWLEADNSGFRLNTSDDNVNANTKSYIFLAIA